MDKTNISIRSDQSTSNFPVTVKYLKNIFNKRKCGIIFSVDWMIMDRTLHLIHHLIFNLSQKRWDIRIVKIKSRRAVERLREWLAT